MMPNENHVAFGTDKTSGSDHLLELQSTCVQLDLAALSLHLLDQMLG